MTIKEVEAQTGITKANIRFYEKEGLLAPERGANNYREYGKEDVECLRKIRMLRIMGFSVAQIKELMEEPSRAAYLMEERAEQIQREVKELSLVRDLCLEARERGWEFGNMDPGLLEMKLEWRKGRDIMKKDRIDWLCRIRDLAFLFCFLCIISMAMFPINQILGIRLPDTALKIWRTVITISPFPALILWAVTAGRARWDVPRMDRILVDSGNLLAKKERDRGRLYERVCMVNQAALTSLLLIPVNRLLGIRLPLWVMGIWVAVIAGLAIAVMALKNRR